LYAGSNEKAKAGCLEAGMDGVVFHGASGAEVLSRLVQSGLERRAMLDPEVYLPVRRTVDLEDVEVHLRHQLQLQGSLAVDAFISPSKLAPDGDMATFARLLDLGESFIAGAERIAQGTPSYATVVLSRSWMNRAEEVVARLRSAGLPVALVLASSYDPVADEEAIEVVEAVTAAVPSAMILRTDLAAVGALALGMDRAAIGATQTTRHLWIGHGSRRGPRSTAPSYAYVPRLQSWRNLDEIDLVEGGDEFFQCASGSAIRDVREVARPYLRDLEPLHMIDAVRQRARHVVAPGATVNERLARWATCCERALRDYDLLGEATGARFVPPRFLRAWAARELRI
jgi:hypothetical protein